VSTPESLQQGCFTFVQGLDIVKIDKTPLICGVLYFNFGGAWWIVWSLTPPKPPVVTGLLPNIHFLRTFYK